MQLQVVNLYNHGIDLSIAQGEGPFTSFNKYMYLEL